MIAASPPVFRFAPSPNGRLHLGHAASALWNEAEAEKRNGVVHLRIEDIDLGRTREAFVEAIVADLDWLGFRHEPFILRQSSRFGAYQEALTRLAEADLTYPCFCSRAEIRRSASMGLVGKDPDGAPIYPCFCSRAEIRRSASMGLVGKDPDGAPIYPRTCAKLPPKAADTGQAQAGHGTADHAIRLDMAKALARAPRPLEYLRFWPDGREAIIQADPLRWGDVVLARKDAPASYHIAVTVDDAFQGVSHVVRGQDLEAATDVHVLLQRLLGLPTPRYMFHPLILDDGQRKLSKSRGSLSLGEMRQEGATPDEIRRVLGFRTLRG